MTSGESAGALLTPQIRALVLAVADSGPERLILLLDALNHVLNNEPRIDEAWQAVSDLYRDREYVEWHLTERDESDQVTPDFMRDEFARATHTLDVLNRLLKALVRELIPA